MPSVKRAFNDRHFFPDASGNNALSNGKLYIYLSGTTTKATTYNSSLGTVANSNPMTLDASGRLQSELWLPTGATYKFLSTADVTNDPPHSTIWTEDVISGIGDFPVTAITGEWIASGFVPTYVSATTFTVPGNQTAFLTVGRALQIVDSGGTKYGWIKTSTFGAGVTTVVLDQNSAALANPISSVAYGIINPANTSEPILRDTFPIRSGSADESKQWRVELDGNTTAQTRVTTIPDYDHKMMTQTQGANVASAATIVLDTTTGDYVHLTGTVAVTAITLSQGQRRRIVTDSAGVVWTNGASLLTTTGANITSRAGDIYEFVGESAGVVRMTGYSQFGGLGSTGAALVLLGSAIASTSASVSFTSLIDSTYDHFIVECNNVTPANDGDILTLRMSVNNGSSYVSAANSYGWALTGRGTDGTTRNAQNNGTDTAIAVAGFTGTVGLANSATVGGACLKVVLKKLATTNHAKLVGISDGAIVLSGPITSSSEGMGVSVAAGLQNAAVNAIQFIMSGGNILSGEFYLYGVRKV